MKRKLLYLLVVLAMLVLSLPAAMPVAVEASTTTLYVPDDYSTIQEAIDAASPGDTIIVKSGTYPENVNVTKPLTIQSENGAASTSVQAADPSDHVFEITADNVTISGFTVRGASVNWSAGIFLAHASHCTISGNTASNNYRGIQLYDSHDNIISQNAANSNDADGILVNGSNRNMVSGNTVNANPGSGIAIAQGNDNCIKGNSVTGSWRGISFIGAPICYNTISNNTISNNNYGIHAYGATSNTICSNSILNNYWYGICLENYANDNTIYLNNFNNNWTNVQSNSSINNWNSPETVAYTYNGNPYQNYLGNYWSDYSEADDNNDGIGDTPYSIAGDNPDAYPLMQTPDPILIPIRQTPWSISRQHRMPAGSLSTGPVMWLTPSREPLP